MLRNKSLPASDIERARKFYEGKLGLRVVMEDPSPGLLFQTNEGTMLYVYQKTPGKLDNTVAAFEVFDIEAEVKALQDRGVAFENYNTPGLGTVNSIATMGDIRAAWFKDTEGNILAIEQVTREIKDSARVMVPVGAWS